MIQLIPHCETFHSLIRILQVQYFDDHFFAYVMQETEDFEMITLGDVADVTPLDLLSDFCTDKL